MKNFKKIVAVLMTIVTLFCSISLAAYAEDAQALKNDEEYVASVYICHKSGSNIFAGHTWLYFVNLTNQPITVGLYSLPKGQGVSVGTYGYLIKDGKGLYYNVEGYRYNHPKTDDFICLKKNLTQSRLDRMSEQIKRSGIWTYLLNCSFSSVTIWNVTAEKFLLYLIIPILVKLSILVYPQHESGFYLYNPKPDQIFKQVGRGNKAYIVQADPTVPTE